MSFVRLRSDLVGKNIIRMGFSRHALTRRLLQGFDYCRVILVAQTALDGEFEERECQVIGDEDEV